MVFRDRIVAAVRAQVVNAGPRYTPQIREGAPNIQIGQLLEPLACLAFNEDFRSIVRGLLAAIEKEFPDAERTLSGFFKGKVRTPAVLQELLRRLTASSLDEVSGILREMETVAKQCRKSLTTKERRIWDELSKLPDTSRESAEGGQGRRRQALEYAYREFRKAAATIKEVTDFLASSARKLLESNIVFIEGGWGTGKTHTLCDMALSRLENNLPVYFVLGKNIAGPEELARGIIRDTGTEELFDYLENEAREIGQRALVIVDGINEGDRNKWREGIGGLLRLAARFPNVGLVMSVRTPFQHSCVPEAIYSKQVKLFHHGFEDSEFDAQKEFFRHYNLNLPEVPILRDEFSRPLVLKIVCEKLATMTATNARRDFLGITSGQMGMTYIFEGFIKEIGRRLEDAHGLQRNFCWKVIKEFRVNRNTVISIAKSMAEQSKDYIPYDEAVDIFFQTGQFRLREEAAAFLRLMVNEGLLLEGVHSSGYGNSHQALEVIQLPYQKFSDHIIARWLLKEHLGSRSVDGIRRSFYANRPLGKIFQINENAWPREYAEPGLAEALMIEFPIRLSGQQYDNKRELIFYLPKDRRLVDPSYSPFLEGLYWRRPMSFGADTDIIISQLLSSKGEASTQTLDMLFVLALKPNHPYGFRRFHRYLENMEMAERDQMWGEYLRKAYEEQTPWRLIEWLSKADCSKIPSDYVSGLFRVLAWMLPTVDRHLRDITTKCLVFLGLEYPRQLFKQCYHSLAYNDPYVPERLLAASYGVVMLKWHSADESFSGDLGLFARLLYRKMFAVCAPYKTHHVLMRDYALGTIALAIKSGGWQITEPEEANLAPPFPTIPSPFPAPEEILQETCDRVKSATHMDFRNYTVGRLIDGRGNYDDDHDEYKAVLKQIHWRMAGLGYDADRFEVIERRDYYGRGNNEGSKIDRYGKKYSWIAYFEMFGWRQTLGLLADYRQYERSSDCDVDPTFVLEPEYVDIAVPDVFDADMKIEDWLDGYEFPDLGETLYNELDGDHWLTIDGYLKSECETDDRSYWVDVRAFLVEDQHVEGFTRLFAQNIRLHDLVQVPEFYYTYFGETPWAPKIEASDANWLDDCPAPEASVEFTSSEYVRDEDAPPVAVPEVRFGDRLFREAGYEQPGRWIESGGVQCIRMAYQYTWEYYHSRCNEVSGVPFLSTAISNQLALGLKTMAPTLFDQAGQVAVRSVNLRPSSKYGTSNALLLRRGLADELTNGDNTIVFLSAGMRDIKVDSSYRQGELSSPNYPDHICDLLRSDRTHISQLYAYKNGEVERIVLG